MNASTLAFHTAYADAYERELWSLRKTGRYREPAISRLARKKATATVAPFVQRGCSACPQPAS